MAGMLLLLSIDSFTTFPQCIDACNHHRHRHFILAALWNDDMRVALARLDKFHIHRADGVHPLLNHGVRSASALRNIALESPDKPHIIVGIDEDTYVEQFPKSHFTEYQNSFH